AEALEWVWAEEANQNRPTLDRRRRRGSLVAWLRGHGGQGHKKTPASPATSVAPPTNDDGAEPIPAALSGAPDPDPAARGARVGSAGAIQEPGTRLERAVSRFNESEHSRTVAGLTRTLGEPQVSVGAAAGSPNEIRLTVAWELSWYQWGVDLGEPSRAVYEIDKGHEISEIDASAREWNAHSSERGGLRIGSAPAKAAGEPAR
ncbi:MAG: hypothetical protein ACRDKV_03600, partial [Solirubrobacterales bacterium]